MRNLLIFNFILCSLFCSCAPTTVQDNTQKEEITIVEVGAIELYKPILECSIENWENGFEIIYYTNGLGGCGGEDNQ